jgi:hypothetical protein
VGQFPAKNRDGSVTVSVFSRANAGNVEAGHTMAHPTLKEQFISIVFCFAWAQFVILDSPV